ncbi:type VII secretion target [Mycobacterium sp. 21AC1]|uniref:type VII secretion target n=1 Tax=[Mycobacterium] appelbergii TaxID=2939269 RepID=UPI0029394AE4|nr:type VII secretion target [Mycobacterium sp. 21AC1]MDV3129391.1 type VII secretion target [Mycobacterium sp. 21AC1]
MLVDPQLLRAFAVQVDSAAANIRESDTGMAASAGADGLPGSTTQWTAREVGAHLDQVLMDIAKDVSAVGVAIRGAGDRYEVDDGALAGGFKGLF